MAMTGLMAHTGKTFLCTREDLRTAPLPETTSTWRPVPHYDLATKIVDEANGRNFNVVREQYAMSKDLLGVFGVISFAAREQDRDSTRMIGFRHDNKKNMALSLSVGINVFVCDNMAFSGERVLSHKHSAGFDFRTNVSALFCDLDDKFDAFGDAVETLKSRTVSQTEARSVLIDACDAGAFASCDIMPIVKEYEQSSVGFRPGSRWSLYNACTYVAQKFTAPKFDNCLRTLAGVFELGRAEIIDTVATPA